MLRTLFLISTLFIVFNFPVKSDEAAKGNLVIAGGAISHISKDIFIRFAELSGGKEARIGIIPAATGSVGKQYALVQKLFSAADVPLENIQLLPLATKDDKNTEADESQWLNNGNSAELAKKVAALTGIWFIGGDQTLITKVLLNDDGSDTKVLAQIRKLYQSGGTIGGTSAGAAIMSDIMIAGGNSQGALLEGFKEVFTSMDEQEYGPVVLAKGFGLFEAGIIDQHFDRKGRLGRLIVTLLNNEQHHLGFGVDEGTAMLVSDNQFQVIGEGGVVVVDTRQVQGYSADRYPVNARNIRLTVVQPGDSYNLTSTTLQPHESAAKTVGHEYFNVPAQGVSGIMNGNRNTDQLLGYNLIDNKATRAVTSWLIGEDAALKMVFSQDEQTQGYWRADLTADVYSVENVRMDITPVKISITE